MTKQQVVQISSRLVAIYLSISAIAECSYVPLRVFAFRHYLATQNTFGGHDYWTDYYSIEVASLLVRIVGLTAGAIVFWKCGSWVQDLFSDPVELPSEEQDDVNPE